MSGNGIICIKQYYQLNGQLSYSHIYLEGETESFWIEQKIFSSPTTSATFASCPLIGGFFCGFSYDDTAALLEDR